MERKAVFVLYLAITSYVIQTDSSIIYTTSFLLGSSVNAGENWSIECTDSLNSLSKLEWYKDGHPLNLNNFTRYSGDLSRHTINSSSAQIGDTGDYKCTPNSEDVIHLEVVDPLERITNIIVWNATTALSLQCPDNGTTWLIEDKPSNKSGKSEIKLQNEDEYGNYTCLNDTKSNSTPIKRFRVVEVPEVRLPKSVSGTEGEEISIICAPALKSFRPQIKFNWTFDNKTYSMSKDRVKLEADMSGHRGAVFKLRDIKLSDGQEISCTAYYDNNLHSIGTNTTLLIVKGKYAALWPFLGILAEVFILCAIILIYEKKRNKADLDESDTDQSPDTKPTPNKDSDVRHRK